MVAGSADDRSAAGERLRTVIADDYPDLRMLFRLSLEMSGRFAVVGEAGNGREAVELTEQLRPNLLLLDVSMPVMDGLEALPLVRGASPDTVVVVLSGFDQRRLGPVALAAGARAYLEKGITPDELVHRLIEVMGTAA